MILEHQLFGAEIFLPPNILIKFIPGRHLGLSAKSIRNIWEQLQLFSLRFYVYNEGFQIQLD